VLLINIVCLARNNCMVQSVGLLYKVVLSVLTLMHTCFLFIFYTVFWLGGCERCVLCCAGDDEREKI